MSDTNYIAAIVKILESPKTKMVKNNILVTKFRAQLPQIRKTRVVDIIVWGNLAKDIAKYYSPNDYILIEGYLSLCKFSQSNSKRKILKRGRFTILKAYPFLLNVNETNLKIY